MRESLLGVYGVRGKAGHRCQGVLAFFTTSHTCKVILLGNFSIPFFLGKFIVSAGSTSHLTNSCQNFLPSYALFN